MAEFNFKPFQKVLVRDNEENRWNINFYGYYSDKYEDGRSTQYVHCCMGESFCYCIPYEGNEHLLGTTEAYVEPWQPKDGDFVTTTRSKDDTIFIYSENKSNSGFYGCYAGLYKERQKVNVYGSSDWLDKDYSVIPATDSEKQQLLDALQAVGQDWDSEKKKIVEYKWKPEKNQLYYYINNLLNVVDTVWNNAFDEERFEKGNCFRTKEEAQTMADKFQQLLKGGAE